MMIADMVEELGHTVVAEAATIEEASALAKTSNFEIAILDINVGGERIDPVAEIIAGRRLPFIFAEWVWHRGPARKNFATCPSCKSHSLWNVSARS
jgi:hypothetical protein